MTILTPEDERAMPLDFDPYDDEPDDWEDDEFDCHMGPGGWCGAAGSEDCEFECPYRRAQRQRASRHDKGSEA